MGDDNMGEDILLNNILLIFYVLSKKCFDTDFFVIFYVFYIYAKTMTQGLCKYRDVLGKTRQGIHARRIGTVKTNFSVNDIISTFVGALVIAAIFAYFGLFGANTLDPFTLYGIVLISLFVAGILLHRLFCVKTTIGQMILPVK